MDIKIAKRIYGYKNHEPYLALIKWSCLAGNIPVVTKSWHAEYLLVKTNVQSQKALPMRRVLNTSEPTVNPA